MAPRALRCPCTHARTHARTRRRPAPIAPGAHLERVLRVARGQDEGGHVGEVGLDLGVHAVQAVHHLRYRKGRYGGRYSRQYSELVRTEAGPDSCRRGSALGSVLVAGLQACSGAGPACAEGKALPCWPLLAVGYRGRAGVPQRHPSRESHLLGGRLEHLGRAGRSHHGHIGGLLQQEGQAVNSCWGVASCGKARAILVGKPLASVQPGSTGGGFRQGRGPQARELHTC